MTTSGLRAEPTGTPALTPRGRATRDRIVAAAAALSYERGVAGTSLDDVRAATGTSKSQLYHYFADKSALVQAVVQFQTEQVLQAQQLELDPPQSLAALRRWARRVVELSVRADRLGGCPLGRLASELAGSGPSAVDGLVAGFSAWRAELADGLRAMQASGELAGDADPDVLALGLLAGVQGGLLLAQATGTVGPLQAALDLALAGVEAQAVTPQVGTSGATWQAGLAASNTTEDSPTSLP